MRGVAGIKSDMSDLSDKSDKMPVTALNKSYSPPSFFLQKESKQRKTLTIYIFFFSIARCSYSARRTAYSSCAAGLPFAA